MGSLIDSIKWRDLDEVLTFHNLSFLIRTKSTVSSDYALHPRIMGPRIFWHIFYSKILAVPKSLGREVGPPRMEIYSR